MMLQTKLSIFLPLLLSIALIPRAKAQSSFFSFNDVSQIFAFGDSYTFVQGTAGSANFSFIGDLLNLNFGAETLLFDEIILKNTSSDGSNWVEFLTGCFEGLPINCSVQLWDFAYAGSDISEDLLPLHHNNTVPLVNQVQQFVDNDVLSIVPNKSDNERLTAWWIGINDTGDILGRNTTSLATFWMQEMEAYFAAVESAYAAGLRGAYLFLNVPPEERSPNALGNAPKMAAVNESITTYNAALSASVANFSAAHPDLYVGSFDAHAWFNAALDNAAALGFTNTTGFCECADPSFFWYNTGHPTEHVHRLLAAAIGAQLRTESRRTLLH